MAPDVANVRERLLRATLQCALTTGFRLTIDQVAHEAGLSRATVYRYFPGGKEQLVSETITWEVGRFFARIAVEVDDAPDFATRVERGLAFGRRAMDDHIVLQKVLREDPDLLLPELEHTMPIVLAALRDYLRPYLADEDLQDDVDVDEAAELLARMFLSYLGSAGGWDLADPAEVRRLVRSQLLAGIVR